MNIEILLVIFYEQNTALLMCSNHNSVTIQLQFPDTLEYYIFFADTLVESFILKVLSKFEKLVSCLMILKNEPP